MIASKIIHGNEYDIYAIEHEEDRALLDFLIALRDSDDAEFRKLLSSFDQTAASGLIKNEHRFKRLTVDIYEFRTFDGIRVLCFIESGSRIVLTNGFKKNQGYDDEIAKAEGLRLAFLSAKASG